MPYHQDQRLPDENIPLATDSSTTLTVEASFLNGNIWQRLTKLYDAVAQTVAAHSGRPDSMPVVISGDCLVALGTIVGIQRAGLDPSIVWFDAHGDIHTLQTSTSGYLGGMALSLAMGRHPEHLAEPLGLRPLSEQQAVLVDARDLDPAEVDFLSTSGLKRYNLEDLAPAVLPSGAIILHIDVDVIDSRELPGMRFPAPDGPSKDAVLRSARRVVRTGRVIALDISCPWNPATDQQEVTARAALLEELTTL